MRTCRHKFTNGGGASFPGFPPCRMELHWGVSIHTPIMPFPKGSAGEIQSVCALIDMIAWTAGCLQILENHSSVYFWIVDFDTAAQAFTAKTHRASLLAYCTVIFFYTSRSATARPVYTNHIPHGTPQVCEGGSEGGGLEGSGGEGSGHGH